MSAPRRAACRRHCPRSGTMSCRQWSTRPRASDEELLALALAEERILITEDKDFGELVFVRRLPHPCIIRFTDMPITEKVAAMRELIESESEAMQQGNIIVVTRSRIRIRRGERGET